MNELKRNIYIHIYIYRYLYGYGAGGLVSQRDSTIKPPRVFTVTSWYSSWYDYICSLDVNPQDRNQTSTQFPWQQPYSATPDGTTIRVNCSLPKGTSSAQSQAESNQLLQPNLHASLVSYSRDYWERVRINWLNARIMWLGWVDDGGSLSTV